MPYLFFIFLICFFKMTPAQAPYFRDILIVRNIGQGQWVSAISYDRCLHFDFGGENINSSELRRKFTRQCANKLNVLFLSHADWDHYAFLQLILKNSRKVCWGYKPPDQIPGSRDISIPFCSELPKDPSLQLIYYNPEEKSKNQRSLVLEFKNFLLPGDSPISSEKKWIKRTPAHQISYLILGHHGSRTSTGNQLLNHLRSLRQAVASARAGKYHHPSPDTISRLKRHRIPLIRTEDWGDIVFR